MIIAQTFWSGGKDPLVDSFGWLSPKYNLMSWALSCLSLRQNYEDVILYTDSNGYKMFHEYLELPYKKIVLQYNNLNCHEDLWAYPKLLTYSIQEKPFVHIDGDVFLPNKLPQYIESGELIAQNAETGTLYYKHIMKQIMESSVLIPDYLLEKLNKDSISSYNAGVIGGNDLKFIKEYCQSAFEFIRENHLNDIDNKTVNINYNILFEQILFHCLAEKKNKIVSTVIDHPIDDNGYSYNEFCDFYSFNATNLMHIIGRHKQNERICELLSRTLLNKYPDYYKRIMEMFPTEHTYPAKNGGNHVIKNPISELLVNMQHYKEFLDMLPVQWGEIQFEDLFEQEKRSGNYFRFLSSSMDEQASMILKKNPYLSIYEIPENWNPDTQKFMKLRLSNNFPYTDFDIATLPDLSHDGFNEVIINDICFNILILLNKQKTFDSLLKEIRKSFPAEIRDHHPPLIYKMVSVALEYLFYHKLIYID